MTQEHSFDVHISKSKIFAKMFADIVDSVDPFCMEFPVLRKVRSAQGTQKTCKNQLKKTGLPELWPGPGEGQQNQDPRVPEPRVPGFTHQKAPRLGPFPPPLGTPVGPPPLPGVFAQNVEKTLRLTVIGARKQRATPAVGNGSI